LRGANVRGPFGTKEMVADADLKVALVLLDLRRHFKAGRVGGVRRRLTRLFVGIVGYARGHVLPFPLSTFNVKALGGAGVG
jgi:hypothetical protein